MKSMTCTLRPNYIRNLHWAKEIIAKGLLAPFFSSKIDPIALKFALYRQTTLLELELHRKLHEQLRFAFMIDIGKTKNVSIEIRDRAMTFIGWVLAL